MYLSQAVKAGLSGRKSEKRKSARGCKIPKESSARDGVHNGVAGN
jgi:hypothetical protein